jgi:hypothetical protein
MLLKLLSLSTLFLASAVIGQTRALDFHPTPQSGTVGNLPRGNGVSDMTTDPVTKAFWIATDKGPCVSTDAGKSWKSFYMQGAFTGDSANCVAIAAKNNFIVVSSASSTLVNGVSSSFGTGIHISTDGGNTWNHYEQPIDKSGDTIIRYGKNKLKAFPWTSTTSDVTYGVGIQGTGTIWIASFAAGLRRSLDSGKTWERVVLPPADLAAIDTNETYNFQVTPVPTDSSSGSLNYEAFSILVENDSIVWVGTADGINRSTDHGSSWTKYNAINSSISGDFVVDMKLRAPGEVWASTGRATGSQEVTGISYTTDDGLSWFRASEILHDTTSSATSLVHKLAFIGSVIYAANDEGIWRSADNGVTWITPSFIENPDTHDVITSNAMISVGSYGNILFIGTSDCLVSTPDSISNSNPMTGPWTFYCFGEPVSTAETNTYAYPNPFQPTQEVTRIRYLVKGEQPVTIEIFDFKMRLLRTVIRDVVREGGSSGTEFKEIWDGTDNYGHRAPNTTLFYKVAIGSDTHWGKIVVIR